MAFNSLPKNLKINGKQIMKKTTNLLLSNEKITSRMKKEKNKNDQNTQNRFLASILSVFLLTIAFFLSNYGCETELPVVNNYYTNDVISNHYYTNDVISNHHYSNEVTWLYETNVVSNQNYNLDYFEVYVIDDGVTNFISSNFVSSNYIAPIITDQTFPVDEHSSDGTAIGQIAATPYGSKTIASYAILSGNGDSLFAL